MQGAGGIYCQETERYGSDRGQLHSIRIAKPAAGIDDAGAEDTGSAHGRERGNAVRSHD